MSMGGSETMDEEGAFSVSDGDDSSTYSDDDGIVVDPPVISMDHRYDNGADCQVLEPEQVANEMNIIMEDVAAIVRLPPTVCRLLLHHYKWNKESLLERNSRFVMYTATCLEVCTVTEPIYGAFGHFRFYESPDPDAFFADANVVSPFKSRRRAENAHELVDTCSICCNRAILTGLLCGHRFCYPCWDAYLSTKIMEEGRAYVACPQLNCPIVVDDEKTLALIKSDTVKKRYRHLIINSFVEVTIEKDGGCNHMTCKNAACKMEFCWMCLGPWEPHGSSWYSCNRFDDTLAKQARDAQERSRAALQRYLHYYNRFMNHQQSLKLESKLYATVKNKMEMMQQANMSWIEVQFLRKAVDVLSECRRTLMYTYAFAFYLQKDNQSVIFEDNQRDLELATEQLSEFLERDLNHENLVTLKQKVQDKYRYVEQRRNTLLKHCAEGVERDFWRFTQ
ncbi:unnamed protein product [Toxocara canis]|uniref:RBR-type E3 ubiquitin transferase n=1 Tax=Toxocara canis TaxID=6265 RepID=A0A183UF96_TOXCA|nr:unnamed protein product [Toxocara canis]